MPVPQFKQYVSLYPVFLEGITSLVMYYFSVGSHIVHKNYVYTKLWKSFKKSKIENLNSTRNEPLILLGYWSKKIEEYFHLFKPDNIHLSDKSTAQDVTNIINSTVKHINYMEQDMIGLQEKFIESENERAKQSICIYHLIQENISTKNNRPPTSLPSKQCTHKSKTIIRNYYKVYMCTE